MNIASLHRAAINGNKTAENQLFARLAARFHLFLRLDIADKYDREEIVQNAMMTIAREYHKIDVDSSLIAWAQQVLRHRMLAFVQSRKRRNARVNAVPDPELIAPSDSPVSNPDTKRRLMDCFRKLGRINLQYARTINLVQQGYNTDEICDRLSLSRNNFYSVLSRARTKLQDCLDRGEIR